MLITRRFNRYFTVQNKGNRKFATKKIFKIAKNYNFFGKKTQMMWLKYRTYKAGAETNASPQLSLGFNTRYLYINAFTQFFERFRYDIFSVETRFFFVPSNLVIITVFNLPIALDTENRIWTRDGSHSRSKQVNSAMATKTGIMSCALTYEIVIVSELKSRRTMSDFVLRKRLLKVHDFFHLVEQGITFESFFNSFIWTQSNRCFTM